ncbi:BatD family protein [Leptospira levettii]|uniref:BatD family protein n=1 Tax=Leptospira levettii TaxID=2023178 RepID=UPI00223D5609|nr:BatD family protein [Leptospira levettii]MCW7473144.1 BatD family protein [Leptospira levettii]
MRNFGKLIPLVCFIFFATITNIYSADVEFFFHPNEFSLGEFAKLEVKAYGDKPFRTLQTNVKRNGVRIRYVGSGTETQIVNFKVSKSQIINFYVDTEQEGNFQLPEITVEYAGKQYSSPPFEFKVSKKTKNPPNSFFKSFPFDLDEPTTEENPEVSFHTNKSVFYKGEPIVGYFVLYYDQYRQPFLERDPNQSISFPFFLSETLRQVTVQIEPEVVRNNVPKKTLVFAKEIYGLTALRSGSFLLGKTKFITGDSLRFNSLQQTIDTKPAKVIVLDLPKNSPLDFSGAIGNFKMYILNSPKQVYVGETAYIEIMIEGEGGFEGISPMVFSNPKIKCISQSKVKNFQQLESGEYGFHSKVKLLYGYQIEKISKENVEPIRFSFFSLAEKKYKTISINFPEFQILPKRKIDNLIPPKKEKLQLELPFFSLVLLAVLGIFGYVALKKYKLNVETNSFVRMVESFGRKRDFFLLEHLENRGVSKSDSIWLTELISDHTDPSHLYKQLSKKDQMKALNIANTLKPKE